MLKMKSRTATKVSDIFSGLPRYGKPSFRALTVSNAALLNFGGPSDDDYYAMALAAMPNREDIAAAAIPPPREWLDETGWQ